MEQNLTLATATNKVRTKELILAQCRGDGDPAAKTLTGTQINYAQIKKGLQAIVFGC